MKAVLHIMIIQQIIKAFVTMIIILRIIKKTIHMKIIHIRIFHNTQIQDHPPNLINPISRVETQIQNLNLDKIDQNLNSLEQTVILTISQFHLNSKF